MLAASKVIGFVPTKDAAKARSFYEGNLGFRFVSEDNVCLVVRAGETMIRIAKTPNFTPAPYTVLGWEVANIEASSRRAAEARSRSSRSIPSWKTKNSGIWTAPSGDKVAWFKDPDGNVLSVSQHK